MTCGSLGPRASCSRIVAFGERASRMLAVQGSHRLLVARRIMALLCMNRRRSGLYQDSVIVNKVKVAVAPAALLLCVVTGFATPQQRAQQGDDNVTLQSHLVNIDVMVKDGKGNFVTNLTAEDFTISENGVSQKIEF